MSKFYQDNIDTTLESNHKKSLMTIEELSEFLKMPINTIYKWTHRNYIPHYKIGKKVRFDLREITSWLETKHIHEKAL